MLVNAGAVVGWVAAESDVQVGQEPVHTCDVWIFSSQFMSERMEAPRHMAAKSYRGQIIPKFPLG